MDSDPDHPTGRFVLLATVADLAAARIAAARLASEGIEVRVHGESLGPYRLTVGDWALTELWVPDDRLDHARTVMLESEVADALGSVTLDGDVGDGGSRIPVGALMVVALLLVAVLIARLVALLM